MVFEVLIEDVSGSIFIDHLFDKYLQEKDVVPFAYNIFPYKGIGKLVKGNNAKNIKSQQLLTELPKRLRAIQETYRDQIEQVCILVVLDNDTKDTDEFRRQLYDIAKRNNIICDHVFCIAVEELEAWFLGDYDAMLLAFPEVKDRIISKYSSYKQDSICGTWEIMADIITKKGYSYFKQVNPTYIERGIRKSEWADAVGRYMDIRNNRSPSFNNMIAELDKRLKAVQ